MTVDRKTIGVYDAQAMDYATRFDSSGKPGKHLRRFMDAVRPGGDILDLGCGPAGAAKHMITEGFVVDAVDASAEMVRVAAEVNGVQARVATFDDINEVAAFDGVWANFSLLHAPSASLPSYLSAIAKALRSGGIFHIGMKVGSGAARDGIDRLYTYVERDELADLLRDAGFTVVATDDGADVGLAGTEDPWVVMMACKDG
ncbi:MAG: class I SAM-dependent methyltransferase [Pseudomonadota bacterium]